MKNGLKIAPDLVLPLETITQTLAILAIKGAGKTNTATVLAEEFLKKGLQVVIADPVGVLWGLRSSADGKDAGLHIVIFGGEKGDVPLEATGGMLVADLVVDEHISAVLDMSLLRKGEQNRFMTDFAERLYHRKGKLAERSPLHFILDEADSFAPQRPMHGQERMLGAIDEIVRRGRARGLGVTLITQRSACINKDVLTQIEVLIAMRTISPQDRKAIEAWIEVHGTPEQQDELMASLPSLPRGVAWVWSPGWLNLFKKVQIRARETFDSSATPKIGDKIITPKTMANVDIEALKGKMAATIEKANADDPRELRKKIAELNMELKKARASKPALVEIKEIPVYTEAERKLLEKSIKHLEDLSGVVRAADEKFTEQAAVIASILAKGVMATKQPKPSLRAIVPTTRVSSPASPPRVIAPLSDVGAKIPSGERKILTALAQYPDGRNKVQVALLTGYACRGGSFNNYLGALRSKGWVENHGDSLRITVDGSESLGQYVPLPCGRELLEHWLGQLGRAEREALRVLAEAYPGVLSKEEVANRAGYEARGGSFNNALGKLRTLELIRGRGELMAAEELF